MNNANPYALPTQGVQFGQQMPPQPPQPGVPQPGAQMPPQPPQAGMPPRGLDPSMIDAVLGMSALKGERGKIERQRRLADMMRASVAQNNDPRGQMVSGRYVGPNIGNVLMSGVAGYLGNRSDKRADEAGAGIDAREAATRRQFLEALRSGGY